MKTTLTSKQRILNAISLQAVDHVPLWLRFWSMGSPVDNIPYPWRDQVARAESLIKDGLDDTLLLQPPLGYVEDYIVEHVVGVKTKVTLIPPGPGETYPCLEKVYDTPGGPLRQVVRVTEDWIHGNDIHLFDDYNVPRQKVPLINNIEDVWKLKYLLADPSPDQMAAFHQKALDLRAHAERIGVALEGGWSALGDAVVWLLGMDRLLYAQMDEPELVEALLDVLLEWELKRMDYVLQEGVDFVTHMAWYEGTDFWTPRNFRRMLKPRLAQLVGKAHSAGVNFRYIITKGWLPMRQDLLDLGIDCIAGVDPVQDKLDLGVVKQQVGKQICLMGGVNSSVMFTQWSDDEIRTAVDEAFRILAPGSGFILYPVDQVFTDLHWEKVQVLIDEWRSLCS
jgi:uroporphyrinogen-III decarboxylase